MVLGYGFFDGLRSWKGGIMGKDMLGGLFGGLLLGFLVLKFMLM